MKFTMVPRQWINWHPASRLDARFWMEVDRRVKAAGLRDDDENGIRQIIEAVERAQAA